MDDEGAREEALKFGEIVSMARRGQLARLSELYPLEFVHYFDQLHSITEKLPLAPPTNTRQRLCTECADPLSRTAPTEGWYTFDRLTGDPTWIMLCPMCITKRRQ